MIKIETYVYSFTGDEQPVPFRCQVHGLRGEQYGRGHAFRRRPKKDGTGGQTLPGCRQSTVTGEDFFQSVISKNC